MRIAFASDECHRIAHGGGSHSRLQAVSFGVA